VNSLKVLLNDFDVTENPKIRVVIIQLIRPRLLQKRKNLFLLVLDNVIQNSKYQIIFFSNLAPPGTWRPRRLPRSPMPGAGSGPNQYKNGGGEVIGPT